MILGMICKDEVDWEDEVEEDEVEEDEVDWEVEEEEEEENMFFCYIPFILCLYFFTCIHRYKKNLFTFIHYGLLFQQNG